MEMLFKHMEANNVAFIILNSSNRWLGIALVSINFYKFTLNVTRERLYVVCNDNFLVFFWY